MTQNHDSKARLEMLRDTIDRNRDNVPKHHDFEQIANREQPKQPAKKN